MSNKCNTRFHSLVKIVTMSGQCVICQVNLPGLGYNWTTFYTLAAVRTGWRTDSANLQLNKVDDNWQNILWFYCVLTCSTTLLGGGIFQTLKSCMQCNERREKSSGSPTRSCSHSFSLKVFGNKSVRLDRTWMRFRVKLVKSPSSNSNGRTAVCTIDISIWKPEINCTTQKNKKILSYRNRLYKMTELFW